MEEKGSPEDSYLEEYDFFANEKKKHDDQQQETRHLQDVARRQSKREAALSWRASGREALSAVQARLLDVKLKLEPHYHYRLSMDLLRQLSNASLLSDKSAYLNIIYHTTSAKILHLIRQSSTAKRRFSIQTSLILWKFVVLRELLVVVAFVPVEKELLADLYKKRTTYRKAVDKLDLIHRTQAACDAIPLCKSIQHHHPKGCSYCGVIFMGGTLSGAIPYVKSVSRDTGVPTLVTLAFELETLEKEDTVQKVIVSKTKEDLDAIESVIFQRVRLAMQKWWPIVLATKRWMRRQRSILTSLSCYRHRRLVKMKRELDIRIRQPEPLTVEEYYPKYCDLPAALIEQIAYLNHRKSQRIEKMTYLFRDLLKAAAEQRRLRDHEEWLRQQREAAEAPPPPPILKTLPPVKSQRLICYRPQCHLRCFLTASRFAVHMSVHAREDKEHQRILAERKKKKQEREEEAGRFLDVLKEYRSIFSEASERSNNKDNSSLTETVPEITENNRNMVEREEEEETEWKTERREVEQLESPRAHRAWLQAPHRYQLTSLYRSSKYYLELVSRAVGVEAPLQVPLPPNSLTRIGFAQDNDCVLSGLGAQGRVEAVHVLLRHDCENVETAQSIIYARDNQTLWGTYVLADRAEAVKLPSNGRSKHSYLNNGTLLCIAAKPKGEAVLSAVTAAAACVVYRLQCKGH
eukprot:gene3808-4158_t